MDEKDKRIQDMAKELAKWKNRAIEAAQEVCVLCRDMLVPLKADCKKCRTHEILEGKQ